MKFFAATKLVLSDNTLVIPMYEGQKKVPNCPESCLSVIHSMVKSKEFSGKSGEQKIIVVSEGKSAQKIVLMGLGQLKKVTLETLRKVAGNLGHLAVKPSYESLSLLISDELLAHIGSSQTLGQAIGSGAVMGNFRFDRYKSTPDKTASLQKLTLVVPDKPSEKGTLSGLKEGQIIGESVNLARELTNTPANELTPSAFIKEIKKLVSANPSLSLDIIDRGKAKKLGMGGFLGVAQGSEEPPYMAVLTYNGGKKGAPPLALVGKGVTFDTGGISIKPSKGMGEMKGDMGGAAAVIGAFYGISKLRPKQNIIGITPLVENMPSGKAMRPGDIIRAMNKKTIEVTNTDAEGRLILADALCYANTFKPKEMINLATLTGAALVALGESAIALMGNHQPFTDRFIERVSDTGEKVWQLPLYEDYFDLLKSECADMINANENRLAGTCTAGKFLEQFVGDTNWIHLDIAPLCKENQSSGYHVKGLSGGGVRTLLGYILSL